ncbi:MAG TPA: DNA lyase [Solirubrobacteraceae bacterium]|nr:DNA lyase [Solirubrobacteraceae bacterium]
MTEELQRLVPQTSRPSVAWSASSRRRVRAIRDRLREVYGIPVAPPHGDALGELILTVLSQSTNDRNRDIAYLGLRDRLPTWEAVRDAPVEEVELAIRRGGISKVKSVRIQAILAAVSDGPDPPEVSRAVQRARAAREDPLDLSWLARVPVPAAQAYLCSLPGVGRKTAACVLLFSFGMRDVPVDTHVSRVAWRLGLFRPRAGFAELHDAMLALTPRGQELELHINLLRHGRRTCAAPRPRCGDCALARMCPKVGVAGESGA